MGLQSTHLQTVCTCMLHSLDGLLHSAALSHQHRAFRQLWNLSRKNTLLGNFKRLIPGTFVLLVEVYLFFCVSGTVVQSLLSDMCLVCCVYINTLVSRTAHKHRHFPISIMFIQRQKVHSPRSLSAGARWPGHSSLVCRSREYGKSARTACFINALLSILDIRKFPSAKLERWVKPRLDFHQTGFSQWVINAEVRIHLDPTRGGASHLQNKVIIF